MLFLMGLCWDLFCFRKATLYIGFPMMWEARLSNLYRQKLLIGHTNILTISSLYISVKVYEVVQLSR